VSVTTTDLGIAACRALMRDMDGKPVIMETYNPENPLVPDLEATSAGMRRIAGQWCAVLSVQPDKVSVSARLKYWGMGLRDYAPLNPADDYFKDYLFVRYPDDPALITGPEYEAELRAATGKAVAAVEADWARLQAEHSACDVWWCPRCRRQNGPGGRRNGGKGLNDDRS